jgi:hypothetical protein
MSEAVAFEGSGSRVFELPVSLFECLHFYRSEHQPDPFPIISFRNRPISI